MRVETLLELGCSRRPFLIRFVRSARSLGVGKARVVGHDIGLMVAYAYAAQYPAEVEKLVLMDAFLPGVGPWEAVYNDPGSRHFHFARMGADPVIVQISGYGPTDTRYFDAANDPRPRKAQ